ncbi:MAG: hypothetical protein ACM3ZE_20360 [Myxococcales bacterium]
MKMERQVTKACLVGIITIFLAGCSGSGAEAPGGAVTGGAASTGGTTATSSSGKTATSTGGTTATSSSGKTAASSGGTTATSTGGKTATSTGGTTATSTGGTATSSGGTTATSTGGGTGTSKVTVLLAGSDVNANGPLQTTVEDLSFSGGGHILVRPTNITKEPNTKHPVAIWGPGGGTPPRDYLQLLTRMASQGFVIVGIRESSGGSELMTAAIDWLEDQNENSSSPMYNRLILNRVGVFGHSMGGLSSEATVRADRRVTTALLDNSGDFGHAALVDVRVPVGIIYGENGQEKPNAEGDYNNPGNKGPCWLGMMSGGGHGSGPWDGAGANVAWMRWHIGGDNSRKDAFLGNGGDYNNRGVWKTQFKNWDGWKNWNE